MNTCISLPYEVTAGLSFQAAVTLSAYPAPAWTVTLHLRGPSDINLTATGDSASHQFSAAPAVTGSWVPGAYWWAIRATDGTDVVEIERGTLSVLPDLVSVTGAYDGRSENEKALDAIEAVLAKRATLDQERYRINNRELYRTPITDLLKLRTFYAAQVRREKAKAGGRSGWGRAIHVRFS